MTMDDDLPPLCGSDAELSDDLPNLEHAEGEDGDADAPAAPAAPAPACTTLPAAGQQGTGAPAGAASAHQQHHGIPLHPHQQHGHHRPQHRGPVSERHRRMEAGINRNSRLWQVPDAEDSLAHSLGASPFDDEHSGPAAHAGVPVQMQLVHTRARDGSMTANTSVSSSAVPGAAHMLSSGLLNRASNNSSQRSGPLFVQGQDRQRGPFQGLAMPFVMGGPVSLVGPAAAGAAAGAAGAPRAAGIGASPLGALFGGGNSSNSSNNPNSSSRTAAVAMGPPSINTSSRATTAQVPSEHGTAIFFETLTNTVATLAEMQGSSDDGSPFRSGPRLRARRMRHNATAAAAARAERSATSPGGTPGLFTFGSTPPQAQPAARDSAAVQPAAPPAAAVQPAPAAAEAAASGVAPALGASSEPAAASAPAAPMTPAAAPAGSSSSGGTSRAKARRSSGDAATAAGQQQQQQQHRQQQGFRWWPPWRILVSGWRLMSWLILGNHSSGHDSSSSDSATGTAPGSSNTAAGSSNTAAGSAAAAAGDTLPARFTFTIAEPAPGATAPGAAAAAPAGSLLFALGPGTALSSSGNSAGSSHARHGASRRGRRARRNHDSSDEEDEWACNTISELENRDATRRLEQQLGTTWRFPQGSSTATAAAAAPGSGGLSGAFSALRQQQQQQEQQLQLEALGPDVDSRPSPSGKRQRAEDGEAVDSSRARSPQALPAQGAAAAAGAAAGQAGASSSSQQAAPASATATSQTQQQQPLANGLVHPPAAAVLTQQRPAAAGPGHASAGQGAAGQGAQQGEDEGGSDSGSDPDSLPELLADNDCEDDSDVSSEAGVYRVQHVLTAAQRVGLASSSTQPAGQQAAPAAPPAAAPAPAAAAAAVDDADVSSELPELLDNMDVDGSGSDGMPGLGSASDSDGPPSLGEGSDTDADDSASWSDGDDGDGPPELVQGSTDNDADSDVESSDGMDMDQGGAMPGLAPGFLNAQAPQRPGQQRTAAGAAGAAAAGGWEPAGLQAGEHSSGLRSGFLQQGLASSEPHGAGAAAQSQPQDGTYYNIGESYYNRQRSSAPAAAANSTSGTQQQQQGDSAPIEFYNMGDSYYNRSGRTAPAAPAAAPAAAAAAVDGDEDSGSEGSWETASDQDVEHAREAQVAAVAAAAASSAVAAGPALRRVPDLYEGSDEDEDEDKDEDEDEDYDGSSYDEYEEGSEEEEDGEECECPYCTSMRLINSPAAMRLLGAAVHGHHHGTHSSGGPPGVFTRPRSNAFMVPNSSSNTSRTTGGLDSLCGDVGSTQAPRPSGLPALPPRRGAAGTRQAGLEPANAKLPEGCITRAESKARVDSVAGLLSDAAFTQQLLQGLTGVDAGHSSIQAALRVLKGKQYTPVNAAVQLMLPGGVARVMLQGELQRSEADRAARQLLRQ